MKLFVVTDVHGFYDEMQSALTKAGFDRNNLNHIFISCGDLFDRGSQPYECLKFVMSLDPKRRILIRGNHEDLMEQAIQRGCFADYDKSNGTMNTALTLTTELNEHDALIHLRLQPLYNAYIQSTQNWAFP
jgi:serine/threonine protein phosphatase 1